MKETPKHKITCEVCSIEFLACRKNRRMCSKLCISRKKWPLKGRKKGKFVPCAYCQASVWVTPGRAKTYKLRFCNKDHLFLWQKKDSFKSNCVICNKEYFTQPCQMILRHRKTCSVACRAIYQERAAEKRRLDNPPTKHALARQLRYGAKAQKWRKAVFERDDYTCTTCKERGGYLEAHHIKPFAYFPELRFDIANGMTLCRKCHDMTKISAKEMKEIYGK